ncbi:hypothetical protein LVJ83_03425 [Uruburuella testudinis]|uniref:ADP-heptose:LPS heptosyltransferase n=1 Tax=Uruburuella testudinis TaxID=1282863 RepID=A0ABY4DU20_9NEIS|nr:glycosyltransferase family 9 protein [Uruburuella testudinis]UOO82532.1 hypothetical protein LVJ83_03425 [Uruburuella testudinis]
MLLLKKMLAHLFGRKKPNLSFDFGTVDSVLIRPMGHLVGDSVAHIAYIRQLKTLYPGCRIGVLVNRRSRPIYECCPLVDVLIEDTFAQCLRQYKKWQLYLDFYETYNSRHIVKTAILAPHVNIIFQKADKAYYSPANVRNYDFHCPPEAEAKMVSWLETSVLAKKCKLPKPDVSLSPCDKHLAEAAKMWPVGKCRILLAPQGSVAERQVSPQELAGLLNNIDKSLLIHSSFLLGHTSNSADYLEVLRKACDADVDIRLSPPTDLAQYLGLVASADIVVCVDSGTVHLACAFRRPLLSFFANDLANIQKWQPQTADGIPSLMVVSQLQPSKTTADFPMQKAVLWLNQQIALNQPAV